MTRYQRQTMLPEIGEAGQQRLSRARVLVVGAGGLSATLLPLLAGAGVGFIRLYDGDRIELHNLHRQTLFGIGDVGQPKAICAQRALAQRNPDCHVEAHPQMLSASQLPQALEGIDLVVDAADNFAITYQLSDACSPRGLPLICASVLGRKGYVGGFCGGAPGYRALFPQLPKASGNCNTAGVMGPAVATLGAMQAQMVLSVLLKLTPSPLGCMIHCDFVDWHIRQFRFDNAPEPDAPGIPFIDKLMLSEDDCIVELRSPEEAPVSVAERVLRILPQQIAAWQPPSDRRVVLVCASGMRAAQAAENLAARGITRMALMAANTL
ncbi:HesA/MoeB/ThiF family protein [Pantoea sp. Bo_2]|uniref:HesA/MoeB/ThiF family protein n=1 Tax=unclassified Pantoea TaxID=2630326 RepID=UPI0012325006|nr:MULTISPECIES: HesA/MoeB/ThiF family protein [unclassified Pantoea]KAA5939258.1 HesA/MoeB/ThiF family protein [Pantoea sp. VH_3]KAA5948136.1 HesA/MoeB/ThiF family protein [Pantoea sp. VH_25]KAA5957140.1 HesA/MoeB/ThiF family protein [Pantoea sp. VH_16]KAA5958015.1 HesA/MoeB/ThiF family protein [Pantoea sp. VH_24]KAA5962427.1 HesA/MoeB/ThiF family protein [Pantoea sp. VH_18]